ncbi:hypothetical protein G7046_g9346 [Stylonectria norvegica]|nr:hypothetical protein G7046_g9346 [Stylonectria norvegica]
MSEHAFVSSAVPNGLLPLLTSHLPFSLPLLRRLQYTKRNGGTSPTARVIVISDSETIQDDVASHSRFTAAYVDVGGSRDTQMWIYSTFEDDADAHDAEAAGVCEKQLARLVDELAAIGKAFDGELKYPGAVLLGTLHSSVREILLKTGRVEPRATGFYDKWLFRSESIPDAEQPLPEGMQWSSASLEDCHVVLARTHIPRTVETLFRMPSLTIKLDDGKPISWAFLGPDASLASLHCEEPYRRRGLAKNLAAKIFRERTLEYGDDGWCSADVAPDNAASRAMCTRLGGKPHWTVSWVLLNIEERVSGGKTEE